MKKILTGEVNNYVGSKLAKDVYLRGFILLEGSTIITKEVADKLSTVEDVVPHIFIESSAVKISSSTSEFLINQMYDKVKTLMNNYSFDGLEDINAVSEIMESIISDLLNNNSLADLDIDTLLIQQPDLCAHALNTSILATLLAIKSTRFQRWIIEQITLGALLHDIGCAEIIEAEGKPWSEIPEEIKAKHPIVGYDLIKDNPYLTDAVKKIVLMHHVWQEPASSFDSNLGMYLSYPSSYYGLNIPPESKSLSVSIVQTADAFEMLTNRSKPSHISKKKAIEEIVRNSKKIYGEGALLLATYISPYAVGEHVKLNNGKEAVVVKHTPSPNHPIIQYLGQKETIDLRTKPFIKILS